MLRYTVLLLRRVAARTPAYQAIPNPDITTSRVRPYSLWRDGKAVYHNHLHKSSKIDPVAQIPGEVDAWTALLPTGLSVEEYEELAEKVEVWLTRATTPSVTDNASYGTVLLGTPEPQGPTRAVAVRLRVTENGWLKNKSGGMMVLAIPDHLDGSHIMGRLKTHIKEVQDVNRMGIITDNQSHTTERNNHKVDNHGWHARVGQRSSAPPLHTVEISVRTTCVDLRADYKTQPMSASWTLRSTGGTHV